MSNWSDYTHGATLCASAHLVSLATELQTRLAKEGNEFGLDEALFILRQIGSIAQSMGLAVEGEHFVRDQAGLTA
ncbi:MAG: hypothetical protein JWP79_3443 [Polaromonas sp.]|jgi:hypothetical protein|nr:hypothetical protein [Polaromonas sp.]